MSPSAKIELVSLCDVPVDVSAVVSDSPLAQTAALPAAPATSQTMRLEEPSTLALALIGVGALVVFRGLQKWVAPKQTVVRATPPSIKPRRRAA